MAQVAPARPHRKSRRIRFAPLGGTLAAAQWQTLLFQALAGHGQAPLAVLVLVLLLTGQGLRRAGRRRAGRLGCRRRTPQA
ncbi:hypothetical protein ABZ260_49465, partial [Streptosporangium sp. NPDC006013]|uniref:hypothetical protein n=1 Tax=Streptosporangium sp. NPDC006013 TaxID=3155596 RepID=UPI0033B90B5A